MGCVECDLEPSLSQKCEEKLFSRSAGTKGLQSLYAWDRRETEASGSEVYSLLGIAPGACTGPPARTVITWVLPAVNDKVRIRAQPC